MQSVYKVVGGYGRCSCGHQVGVSRVYYLVDMKKRAYSLCEHCGKMQGLAEWWGTKREISTEEMRAHWFGAEPIKEVACRQLKQYIRESKNSTKKEEMLRVAVEV